MRKEWCTYMCSRETWGTGCGDVIGGAWVRLEDILMGNWFPRRAELWMSCLVCCMRRFLVVIGK